MDGAGVGAEIIDKGEAGAGVRAENKLFLLRNTGFYSLNFILDLFPMTLHKSSGGNCNYRNFFFKDFP